MRRCNEKSLSYIDQLLEKETNERLVAEMLPKTASDKTNDIYAYLRENYPAETLTWVRDAKWTLKDVPLSTIQMARRPGGARELDKVKNIASAIKDGQTMDPVVLVSTPGMGKFKIADGYHRTLGFEHANKSSVKAWVGEVKMEKGPWDKEMHEKKLNVGKKAFEEIEAFNKEAAIGAIGNLALKAGKGLVNQTVKAGKSLSGTNVYQASKAKKTIRNTPDATKQDIKQSNKNLRKAQLGMVGSWGAVGGATAAGNATTKLNEERKKMLEVPDPNKLAPPNKNPYFTY